MTGFTRWWLVDNTIVAPEVAEQVLRVRTKVCCGRSRWVAVSTLTAVFACTLPVVFFAMVTFVWAYGSAVVLWVRCLGAECSGVFSAYVVGTGGLHLAVYVVNRRLRQWLRHWNPLLVLGLAACWDLVTPVAALVVGRKVVGSEPRCAAFRGPLGVGGDSYLDFVLGLLLATILVEFGSFVFATCQLCLRGSESLSDSIPDAVGLPAADAGGECSICMEGWGQKVKRTGCGHYFHGSCLSVWLKTSQRCPLCRQNLTALHGNVQYESQLSGVDAEAEAEAV
eukprot:CAMPEP_0204325132 /NCGR_PEP_ID=MMETSP0469-20131031/10781_1 /ASSEMBLY_ACC=CAM_ASM_000384 /TAXON_ID=2969 /ORGANISM="Oxyrrhis marina" /LENGTH=280 /DNA_ID=CAMNT_0051306917 /DNA_START=65 /DNA_END=907 /DNA_ORIENTATION=+